MSTNVAISPQKAKSNITEENIEDRLKYNKKNFLNLKYEIIRLQDIRLQDLRKINELQDHIIELYNRINADSEQSPLRVSR